MNLELIDSRRLTGANLFWDRPSAILDVAVEGAPDEVIAAWRSAAESLLQAVGRSGESLCHRSFEGGASLLISAPIDALYSMCELNEVAWMAARHALGLGEAPDLSTERQRLSALFAEEANPALLALQSAAQAHEVPFLWDDDLVSVGYGATTLAWEPRAVPPPGEVDWGAHRSIPLALVTGTNGKSTTVRMTAAILAAAGYAAGLTSTDFIRVGERTIDTGDYSGTGGARLLLRQPDVEAAVLEVARGGLLRRGLGVEHANVAVITNVAADHLGEYGIHSVADLLPAKFIVRRALGPGDTLVLNADDDGVAAFGAALDQRIAWFSLDPGNARIRGAAARGGAACYAEDGWLVAAVGDERRSVTPLSEVPSTRGGLVRHNVSNALAAMAAALALGVPDAAVRAGLSAFRGDASDNPGRANWFERETAEGTVRILVDFAHNAHGMQALAETVRGLPAERIVLLMGQAGDRLDQDIAGLVQAACAMQPDRVLVAELPGYERGRPAFEVPALIRRNALACGVPESRIALFPNPLEAVQDALADARGGDLLVLLTLTQRQEALALIREFVGDG